MSDELAASSWATSAAVRASMLGNRRRDTTPELAVRRVLHAAGLRYRVDYPLPVDRRRRADVVFTRQKVAVFIDGCFWHGCPEHGTTPKQNADYWGPKLARNRARDLDTTQRLTDDGWIVLRFWEHQDRLEVAATILDVVHDPAVAHGLPPGRPAHPAR